tara:strand:+ start:873 stop:1574 length:702 start_codon:yes stop_codon:yes gene_type:complete
MTIKAIFFDFYNTLSKFDPPREELQIHVCKSFGIDVTKSQVLNGYALADSFMAKEIGIRPLRSRSKQEVIHFFAEYQRLVIQGSGIEISIELGESMFRALRKLPYDFTLFEDAILTLRTLKDDGLTLGLLSNNDEDMDATCDKLGLSSLLDFIITPVQVGSGKPKPEIFLRALDIANVAPNESIHVGDQYESDIKGALGVGIKPILIDRDDMYPNFNKCVRIRSLLEIRPLIK